MSAIQTIQINVPSSDLGFINELIRRMGWTTNLSRTSKTNKVVSAKKISMQEAVNFVSTLSRKGKKNVPADERGIEALIDSKYYE